MYEQDQTFTYEYEQDNEYDWDLPIDDQYFGSYMIQASDRTRRFRPSLPCSVWGSLSKLNQQTWYHVSIKGKWSVIKGLRQSVNTDKSTTKDNFTSSTQSLTKTHLQQSNGNKFLSAKIHYVNEYENLNVLNDQYAYDMRTTQGKTCYLNSV